MQLVISCQFKVGCYIYKMFCVSLVVSQRKQMYDKYTKDKEEGIKAYYHKRINYKGRQQDKKKGTKKQSENS